MRAHALIPMAVVVVLTSCGGGIAATTTTAATIAVDCPPMRPPPSAASFEIRLPDGRVGRNPPTEDGSEEGNEWEIDITAGTAAEFAVTVDIYPEVVLETLQFRITSVNGAEVWSVNAGESLSEGRHQVVVTWDGLTREGDPVLGKHHLFASATIEHDYRNACYGDLSGGHQGWGLGYLDVVSP